MAPSRIAATAVGSLALALVSAAPAQAAPPGPRIIDAYIVEDLGTPGLLDLGDSFAFVFNGPIRVHGPEFGICVVDADGDQRCMGDQGPEITSRVKPLIAPKGNSGKFKVSADRVLVMELVELHGQEPLDLPLTLTEIGGVTPPPPDETDADLSRSTDVVID